MHVGLRAAPACGQLSGRVTSARDSKAGRLWIVPLRIEEYGIIGDTHTAALVGSNGSIDWLCLPRFDSEAVFASLLGDENNGYWKIAPAAPTKSVTRSYRGDTLVLDTEFTTGDGVVRVTDCMPIRESHPEVIRRVEGLKGTVAMHMCLAIRMDYGKTIPWVRAQDGLLTAIAGPNGLALWTPAATYGRDFQTHSDFKVSEGQTRSFALTWFPSYESPPRPIDAAFAVADTVSWWEDWSSHCTVEGPYRDAVLRSLITLKALTLQPTGGIVAAATTSLPETLGGVRNWDYRYCWLRDATLTLTALMRGGFHLEAMAWRDWLLRAVAGDPSDLQIMYGPAGERRLEEWEVDWLPGYESSRPVRVGNAAAGQFQLDVYGEVMAALYEASRYGDIASAPAWELQKALMDFLETGWKEPDDGIWEVRGPRRHFTHSKVMAWVAVDRAIRAVEDFGLDGPVTQWRQLRTQIHAEVLEKGYNSEVGAFTQYYGATALDASLLMIPLFGFLPAKDKRVVSTVEAIQRNLTEDGFVLRYKAEEASSVDGLSGHEGAFIACSFWMADCLGLMGRKKESKALLERLLDLRNDLGLLAEEYDAVAKRQVGNFPQAFSHVSLVNAACNLSGQPIPSARKSPEAVRALRHAIVRGQHTSARAHGFATSPKPKRAGTTVAHEGRTQAGADDAGMEGRSRAHKSGLSAGRTAVATKRQPGATKKRTATAPAKKTVTARKTSRTAGGAKKTPASKTSTARKTTTRRRSDG
jgi:GH15 family glucan-1,4-alpha-glucosidase